MIPTNKLLPPPPLVLPPLPSSNKGMFDGVLPDNYKPYIIGGLAVFVLGIIAKKVL